MKKIISIFTFLLFSCLALKASNPYAGYNSVADTSEKKPNFCLILAGVVTQTNEKCYGQANGNAVILVGSEVGGTGPYTWSWSPTATNFALDTLDAANGLSAGTYTVTITDASGCTSTVTVKITQPPPIVITTNAVTEDKCNGSNNGAATISASGGTPSYTYNWAPSGGAGTSATNLTAGAYIVTVTDSNKCTNKDTVTITQPPAIATATTVVSSSCSVSDGSAKVVASGGNKPYSYSWSSGQTIDSITGVGNGIYVCTVTDSIGCQVQASVIVTDSTTLTATLSNSANVSCYGMSNGLAAYNITGGMGPDTYGWAPTGGTGMSASGLIAGTYTFTATDSLGCKALSTVTITQPNMLHDTMTNIRNVACFGGATGRVTSTVTGGTSPFTYVWSTGATSSNVTGLTAGSYSVAVIDNNGCKDSASITIKQPATAVADSNTVANVTCYGNNSGTITVNPYGGVSPYTYTWTPAGNTTNTATALSAGTYIVSIRDSNRCRHRDTVVVTQPPSFIVQNDTTISQPCQNTAWVVVTGNLSNYSFSWSNGATGDTATGLCSGTYYVSITDSAGCTENDTLNVGYIVGIQQYSYDPTIKVYPVPTGNKLTISIADNNLGDRAISVFDMTGREVLVQKVSSTSDLLSLDVSQLAEGTYFLKLTGTNSTKTVKFSVAGK